MTTEEKPIYKSLISFDEKLARYREEKNKIFINENAIVSEIKEYFSDSKKYVLVVIPYRTCPENSENKTWNYTLGCIFKITDDGARIPISEVQRDYHSFHYCFVENHDNGHDYLICGEHYQGYTIVELDTGKKNSWIGIMGGWCWAKVMPSPSKNLLAVDGCAWGAPYEYRIFDFSEPLNPHFDCLSDNYEITEFKGWNEDDTCSIVIEYETRKSDGKPVKELSEEEEEALEKQFTPGTDYYEFYGFESKEIVWKKP